MSFHTEPETFRVRMVVDISDDMRRAAEKRGTTATALIRDGLNLVFARMIEDRKAKGWLHDVPTDSDGRVKRGREFAIGS